MHAAWPIFKQKGYIIQLNVQFFYTGTHKHIQLITTTYNHYRGNMCIFATSKAAAEHMQAGYIR